MMYSPLINRTVLITGSGRNLGRAMAIAFAKAGCRIAVNVRQNIADGQTVVSEIEALGGEAIVVKADVGKEDEVYQMFREIQRVFGSIDILINNATARHRSKFTEIKTEQWRNVMDTILTSTFLCSQSVIPKMIDGRWGRIVNISASTALKGRSGRVHQMAAKMGVMGLTKSLAVELAPHGITVNSVAPGVIHTEKPYHSNRIQQLEEQLQEIPMGRLGHVDEVVPLVVFLCTSGGSYITGQVFSVNGGFYM